MLTPRLFEKEKLLWLHVLYQAIKDYIKGDTIQKHEAYYWFMSKETEINSFVGICDILDCNPEKIRDLVFRRELTGIVKKFINSMDKYTKGSIEIFINNINLKI